MADENFATGFAQIFEMDTCPDWLSQILPRLIDILAGNMEAEKNAPNENELQNRLNAIHKSSDFLLKQLRGDRPDIRRMIDPNKFTMEPHLMNEGEFSLPMLKEITLSLKFLRQRAKEKLDARPQIGPGRPGPKPAAEIDNFPDSKSMCALMVRLIWQKAHQMEPGDQNKKALEACEALWREAGGTRPSAWSDTNAGWRTYLKNVRKFSYSDQAIILRRWIDSGDEKPIADGGQTIRPKTAN